MTITEFNIIVFKSPPDLSDVTLRTHFQTLSEWQSDCSGFPLVFYADLEDPHLIHLVTGWTSVAAHEAWIRGERNQTLLRLFAPYVDLTKIRMVHLGMDFEALMPSEVAGMMVVERYHASDDDNGVDAEVLGSARALERGAWSLFGKDLDRDSKDVFRFAGAASGGTAESPSPGGVPAPVERWVLKRIKPC